MVTLEEAKKMISLGATVGDVLPQLDESLHEDFKKWFVHEQNEFPAQETIAKRKAAAKSYTVLSTPKEDQPLKEVSGVPKKEQPSTYVSVEPCWKCGGQMFIPGPCPTCANCGESSKGCG